MTPKQEYDALKAHERAERQREDTAKQNAHDIMQGLADFFRGTARIRSTDNRNGGLDYWFIREFPK